MHPSTIWRNFNVVPIHFSMYDVGGSWHWWWDCWKMFHEIQESFVNFSIDGNGKWWLWACMMNVDANVDDLKDYANTSSILDPGNPPTSWRNVSYLTRSNFYTYKYNLKEFQRCPHSLLNVRRWWIITLVMGLLEYIPWHFKRVSTKIPWMEMVNDANERWWKCG